MWRGPVKCCVQAERVCWLLSFADVMLNCAIYYSWYLPDCCLHIILGYPLSSNGWNEGVLQGLNGEVFFKWQTALLWRPNAQRLLGNLKYNTKIILFLVGEYLMESINRLPSPNIQLVFNRLLGREGKKTNAIITMDLLSSVQFLCALNILQETLKKNGTQTVYWKRLIVRQCCRNDFSLIHGNAINTCLTKQNLDDGFNKNLNSKSC